ncbi:uncharacterized protein [Branchiostoma lanceolatum]|uniref:uncharacterized protein isoform X2 n=1 Tax=Branchiostoma lanceolatum TaxID=7740 RepID=UPI003454581F
MPDSMILAYMNVQYVWSHQSPTNKAVYPVAHVVPRLDVKVHHVSHVPGRNRSFPGHVTRSHDLITSIPASRTTAGRATVSDTQLVRRLPRTHRIRVSAANRASALPAFE